MPGTLRLFCKAASSRAIEDDRDEPQAKKHSEEGLRTDNLVPLFRPRELLIYSQVTGVPAIR